MRRLLWLIALSACGPVAAPPEGRTARQPIIGGTLALQDSQVFALGTSQGMFCTATLIGERTLLTAAHCIGSLTDIEASNQADVKGWPGNALQVVDQRMHPKWNGGDHTYDVGLLLLSASPEVAPKAWNRVPLTMQTVPEVRALGYGETHVDGSGVRREANVAVNGLTDSTLLIGNGSGPTVCFGDSGGPSFRTFTDGVERVVGVHSFSNSAECNGGGDVRVDSVADFIDQWTREKAPTCATDGACVMDCPTQDRDCFCLADGLCNASCPLPDTDSDCPKHCLPDGVCAFGGCGVPDVDCFKDGQSCESAERCSGHQCLSDAQREQPYCSRTCHSSSECNADMRCEFGLCRFPVLPVAGMGDSCQVGRTVCSGGVCAGQSDSTTICRLACNAAGDCPGSYRCVGGVQGVRYCQGLVVLPLNDGVAPRAPQRCSVSGVESGAVLLALALLRRRSARR